MSKESIIKEMWRVFAEGLGGHFGYIGPLSMDWHTVGVIHGLRRFREFDEEAWELSYWMMDFAHGKISLEG